MNTKRIDELDYLRGFALLGIIFANIESILNLNINYTDNNVFYRNILNFIIEGKFFTIFSFLFGIGFFIFMSNAEKKDRNMYALYIRRIIILGIFGYFHSLLQPGEALLIYAILGIFLIPIFKFNKYINLTLGSLLFIIFLLTGLKAIMPLPYFILGIAVGQFNFILYLKNNMSVLKFLTLLLGVLSIICWLILSFYNVEPHYSLLENQTKSNITKYANSSELFDEILFITSPIISAFYCLLLVLFVQSNTIKKILSPLKYYGQMALTNYIGQTVFIVIFGMFINSEFNFSLTFIVCLLILIIQLIISKIWLRKFKYGPLEYIWKCGTYLDKVGIKYESKL